MKQKSIDELLAGWRTYREIKKGITGQATSFNHNLPEDFKPEYKPGRENFETPMTKPESLCHALQRAEAERWEYTAVEVAIKGVIAGWGDSGLRVALAYCSRGVGSSTIADESGIKRHVCSAVIRSIREQAPAAFEGIRAARWLRAG